MARKPGKQPQSDDQRLQSWLEWYDRNQQKSEYRRQYYAMLTAEQREQRRLRKKELYRQRIEEGWAGPYRKNRTDHMKFRELLMAMLFERDRGICGICGKPVSMGEEGIDHIVPLNMGGPNTPANIRLAHRTCNNRRPKKPKDLRLALEKQASKEALN